MAPARVLILAGSVVALTLTMAQPASSGEHPQKQVLIKTRIVEFRYDMNRDFLGDLQTKKDCRDDRLVSLWYSQTMDGPQQKLGTDRSSKSGEFDIHLDIQPQAGFYSASAKKDKEKEDGELLVCKLGVTPRVFF